MDAADPPVPASVPLVEVVRSGFVEGRHHGSAVALSADGEVASSFGDVSAPVLPRSCSKPLQAVAMVRAGLDLPDELLALACASHSGEEFHLDGVRRILASVGLDEQVLQTPPDLPLDEQVRDDRVRAGGGPEPILMNCSGKHAAMLATCVANGWDVSTYLSPEHPLQRAITGTFEELTGSPVAHVAVDGCGAPLLGTPLVGLARAFRRLALAAGGPERRVAEAIRSHPSYVSGSGRDERALLAALPGAIGKSGAEAVYAVALPDGRAFALKIEDGGGRARPVAMVSLLERAGVLEGPSALLDVDVAAVRATGRVELHGGGRVVGELRACF